MKSKIYAELSNVTALAIKRGQDVQEFFIDLLKAVANLKDADWDNLSTEAQDWYNAAAKAKNKKEAIVTFPDLEADKEEKAEEEAPRRSRRKAEDEDDTSKPMLKVGDEVTVVTAKGTERTGKIIEQDDKVVVIDDGNDEYEYKRDSLKSITKKHGDAEEEAPRRSRRKADEEDEPAVPEIKAGSKVVAVTKRGKTIEGVVEKISDTEVSIDDGKEVWDFDIDRLESLSPAGGKAAKEEKAEEEAPRRGRATKEKEEPAKEEGARTRASNAGGVSIGQRIRELIAEDLAISEESIAKQLKKEGIEFKENTLNLNYKESMKFIDILKAAKRLK